MKKKTKRRQECLLRDLATALMLCNNVTPVIDEGIRVLQASSPDEIALVRFAEELGYKMKTRDHAEVIVIDPAGQEEVFRVMANFPFSSETKRMGVIVRHESTQRLILYLKGADMVMITKCKAVYRAYIQD